MSGDFGQTNSDDRINEDVFRVNAIGEHVIRFVNGYKSMNRVWLPIIFYDNETGEENESWRMFNVKGNDSLFSKLSAIDKSIQKIHGIEKGKIRSQFDSSYMAAYLIFVRSNSDVVLEVGEFKWSIRKRLNELRLATDPADAKKLLNGPWWCYDTLIKRFATEGGYENYSIEPYKNKFGGKIGVGFSPDDKFDPVSRGVFTQEEYDAIESFKAERNIKKLQDFWDGYEPYVSNEEIKLFFENGAVVDLNRKTKKDVPFFKYPEELAKKFEEIDIAFRFEQGAKQKMLVEQIEEGEEEDELFPEEVAAGSLSDELDPKKEVTEKRRKTKVEKDDKKDNEKLDW